MFSIAASPVSGGCLEQTKRPNPERTVLLACADTPQPACYHSIFGLGLKLALLHGAALLFLP